MKILFPLIILFFDKLNNKFVYLAHDDGWHNKILHKDKNDYVDAFRNLFPNKLKAYKKNVQPISLAVGQQLISFASHGLLIEIYRTIKTRNGLEIPINIIGDIKDHDDVYNNMDRHKARAKSEYWLVYKNKQWMINSYK